MTPGKVLFKPMTDDGDQLRSMTMIPYLEDLHCEEESEGEYDEEQIFSDTHYNSKYNRSSLTHTITVSITDLL